MRRVSKVRTIPPSDRAPQSTVFCLGFLDSFEAAWRISAW